MIDNRLVGGQLGGTGGKFLLYSRSTYCTAFCFPTPAAWEVSPVYKSCTLVLRMLVNCKQSDRVLIYVCGLKFNLCNYDIVSYDNKLVSKSP